MASRPRLTGRDLVPFRGNPNDISTQYLTAAGLSENGLRALTAAGFRITHQDSDQLRRLIQPWQTRAFNYYDQLGEVKYAAQFYSRMLSPLRLYAAEFKDGDWVETEDELAVSTLARVQDPGGGYESLLGSYGRLMFLVGECYLLCTIDPDTEMEQWEMLSTDELRIQSGIYVRYKAPSLVAEQLREPDDDDFDQLQAGEDDDSAVAYRLWRRHPRYSMLADSTMMGVLELCEELLLLTRAVRARARSRLAGSGILAISEDFSFAPLEATPGEDPAVDPFMADLTTSMMLPIANEGTASAVVPLVVRGPTTAVKDGIRHIPIVDPMQLYPETGLRNECIDRIAIGLDLPPEILKGLADANHWSAWAIDEQTWKAHGMPVANQLVNDLTAAFFRPTLKDAGRTDWAKFAIRYDPADVINHPDRTKDAREAFDRRVIGKKAYRRIANFAEEDAPDEQERAEMVGIAVRDGSLAWFGIPSPRSGGLEPSPGELIDAANPGPGGQGDPQTARGAEVEKGPPEKGATQATAEELLGAAASNGNGHVDAAMLAKIVGAADLALFRAREAAGNRIRTLCRRDSETTALIDGVLARDVAHVLGPDRVKALGVTETELVQAGSTLIREALSYWLRDDAVAALVAKQIEQHAARTLYEERPVPLPPQFAAYVSGVFAKA